MLPETNLTNNKTNNKYKFIFCVFFDLLVFGIGLAVPSKSLSGTGCGCVRHDFRHNFQHEPCRSLPRQPPTPLAP